MRATFFKSQNVSNSEQKVLLTQLIESVTCSYFLKNNLSNDYKELVKSKVSLSFFNNFDDIKREYKGSSQFSTYCIAIMYRLIQSTIRNDLKLVESA